MVFSLAVPASQADTGVENFTSVQTEKPVFTTAQFLKLINPLRTVLKSIFGTDIFPESNFSVEFQEGVALDLCNYICENSGLDIVSLSKNIPLDTSALEFFYTLTQTDTTAVRDELYKIRYKYDESGNSLMSTLFFFLGNYLSVIKKIDIYSVPAGDDGTVQVAMDISRLDGTTLTMPTDVYFSPDGLAYGSDGKGLLGLGFECSVYDLFIYATVNCWMHDFGFCFFYDWFCYTTPFFNYRTRRFKFDYDGKEWMVQVWKGNYVITNGSEVGVYCRDREKFGTYYDCYDGLMNMSLKLEYGDTLIYETSAEHWWLNGFKIGDTLYSPSAMTMSFSVELLDEEMANALADAINSHYMHDVSCTVDGKTVSAVW